MQLFLQAGNTRSHLKIQVIDTGKQFHCLIALYFCLFCPSKLNKVLCLQGRLALIEVTAIVLLLGSTTTKVEVPQIPLGSSIYLSCV